MSSLSSPVDPTGILTGLGADTARNDELIAALAAAPADSLPGRVSRAERGGVDVRTPIGTVRATTGDPVSTGDWVVVDRSGDPPRLAAVLERRTALERMDADGESVQILAANVDEVWVVVPLDRPVQPGRVERGLVLAWESGAVPVVVATKTDLASDVDLEAAERDLALAGPGTPVMLVSATEGNGLAELQARIASGRTAALLGASGAGKSSLVNALAGREVADVGDLRAADGKGRHTTAWRELVLAAGGGVLVDSPGLRAVGVWLDEGGIDATFSDVVELAAACRFSDCAHDQEPDCAVRAAIADGRLAVGRLERYRKLQREAARNERHQDARAAAEQRRIWAIRSRQGRSRARRR